MIAHQLLHLFRNANSWLLFIRPSWVWLLFGYFPLSDRASLGFRQAHNLKVAGSNPAPATMKPLRTQLCSVIMRFDGL